MVRVVMCCKLTLRVLQLALFCVLPRCPCSGISPRVCADPSRRSKGCEWPRLVWRRVVSDWTCLRTQTRGVRNNADMKLFFRNVPWIRSSAGSWRALCFLSWHLCNSVRRVWCFLLLQEQSNFEGINKLFLENFRAFIVHHHQGLDGNFF